MKYRLKRAEQQHPHYIASCQIQTLTEIPETASDHEYLRKQYPGVKYMEGVVTAHLPKIPAPDWRSIAMMQAYDRRLREAKEFNESRSKP